MFSLQVNGEVLWKWKDICGNPGTAFALIQRSLTKPLGHQLENASRDRVRHALACHPESQQFLGNYNSPEVDDPPFS